MMSSLKTLIYSIDLEETKQLYYAKIHPMMAAHTVFSRQLLREQLYDRLYQASRIPIG